MEEPELYCTHAALPCFAFGEEIQLGYCSIRLSFSFLSLYLLFYATDATAPAADFRLTGSSVTVASKVSKAYPRSSLLNCKYAVHGTHG